MPSPLSNGDVVLISSTDAQGISPYVRPNDRELVAAYPFFTEALLTNIEMMHQALRIAFSLHVSRRDSRSLVTTIVILPPLVFMSLHGGQVRVVTYTVNR